MAIVRVVSGTSNQQTGLKVAGKKAAKKSAKKGAKKSAGHAIEKQAAKKHAAKKHQAKKHADKHPGKKAVKHTPPEATVKHAEKNKPADSQSDSGKLVKAFHHMQRAAAVISLVEKESNGDLRDLLTAGTELYQRAAAKDAGSKLARQALAFLKALEHLAMAGLYSARIAHRVPGAEPVDGKLAKRLRTLRTRLEKLGLPEPPASQSLLGLAWELLRRADAAGDDVQLEWELATAADELCSALERRPVAPSCSPLM